MKYPRQMITRQSQSQSQSREFVRVRVADDRPTDQYEHAADRI